MTGLGLIGRHLARSERGAAMVEFAIVTPLLLTMAFGVIDFGRAFYVYNLLNSVARDGARLGAAQGVAATSATIKTRIINEIVPEYRMTGATAPTAEQITVTLTGGLPSNTGNVTVTIHDYAFTPWVPVLPIAQNLTLNTSATFRREIF